MGNVANSSYNEIILCPECNGYGAKEERVSVNETDTTVCTMCGGAGRLVKTVKTIYGRLNNND